MKLKPWANIRPTCGERKRQVVKPSEKREYRKRGIERGSRGKIEERGRGGEGTGETHSHLLAFPHGCGCSLWHTETAMHIRAALPVSQILFPTEGFVALLSSGPNPSKLPCYLLPTYAAAISDSILNSKSPLYPHLLFPTILD